MLFPWYTKYPYQNNEILNLDWVLNTIDNLVKEVSNFVSLNTIKYADPIQWNITTQYEKNTVVVDPVSGSAYISTQPVPAGVGLNNTDYWNIIFTLDVISANKNITLRDDANNTLATFESSIGDWLLWNGTLYVVTKEIQIGQAYVDEYNIERATVEYFIKLYIENLKNNVDELVGDLDDLDSSVKTSIVAAINSVISAYETLVGDLDDLSTTDKDSIVDAINEVVNTIGTLSNLVGDLDDLSTTDKDSIVDAINEIVLHIGDLTELDTDAKNSIVAAINELQAIIENLLDYIKDENTSPASLMSYNSTPVNNISRLNVVDGNDTTPSESNNNPSVMINRVDDSYHGDTSKNAPGYILYDLYATMKRIATSCGYASTILGYMEDNTENGSAPGGSTQSVAVSGMAYVTKNSSVWALYGDVYNKSEGLANVQACELNVRNETNVDYPYNPSNPTQYPFSCGNWIVTGGNADNSFAVGISTFDIVNSHWHVGEYYAPYSVIDIGIDMQATPTTNIKLHGAKTDPLNPASRGGIGIDFDGHYSLNEATPEVNHGAIHLHNEAICFGQTGLGHILFNQNNGTLEFWYNGSRRGYINMGGTDHEL